MRTPVSSPFTTSWKNSMMAYAVQNARRRSSAVRSTARSITAAPPTPSRAAIVYVIGLLALPGPHWLVPDAPLRLADAHRLQGQHRADRDDDEEQQFLQRQASRQRDPDQVAPVVVPPAGGEGGGVPRPEEKHDREHGDREPAPAGVDAGPQEQFERQRPEDAAEQDQQVGRPHLSNRPPAPGA